jgi:hypothetical protein
LQEEKKSLVVMETLYYINFVIDQHSVDPEIVRKAFGGRLRRLNLKYRSEHYRPESGWSTPAYGVPEELDFCVEVPKDRLNGSRALHRLLCSSVKEIEMEYKGVADTTIERVCRPAH